MNAPIHIVVLLCLGIADGLRKDLKETSHNSGHQRGFHNYERVKRGYDSLPICDRAILSCCADTKDNQRLCFHKFQCSKTYNNGAACSQDKIDSVLHTFSTAYASNDSDRITRGKRWHYTYNESSTIYPSRREITTQVPTTVQQDYLPRIVSLLEEITTYVRHPQPQHISHPIYIPYPIPYYPYTEPADNTHTNTVPDIFSRGPEVSKPPIAASVNTNGDDVSDGGRPISFVPIKSDRALKRVAPKVEHGSVQSESRTSSSQSSSASLTTVASPVRPQSACTSAILACCADKAQQKNCFYTFGCGISYNNGNACNPDSIKAALALYTKL